MGVTFGVSSPEQIFRLLSFRDTDIHIHIYIVRMPGRTKALCFPFFFFFRFLLKIAVYVQITAVVHFTGKLRFLLIVGLVLRVYWGVSEHR